VQAPSSLEIFATVVIEINEHVSQQSAEK
jgi:hypothetical protein